MCPPLGHEARSLHHMTSSHLLLPRLLLIFGALPPSPLATTHLLLVSWSATRTTLRLNSTLDRCFKVMAVRNGTRAGRVCTEIIRNVSRVLFGFMRGFIHMLGAGYVRNSGDVGHLSIRPLRFYLWWCWIIGCCDRVCCLGYMSGFIFHASRWYCRLLWFLALDP